MINTNRKMFVRTLVAVFMALSMQNVSAYEVAVGLGSTAGTQATIDMGDRSKWPVVADLSWGPLANFYPIGLLPRDQQEAVFNNFKQRQAISEIPYEQINWSGPQGAISHLESFGFTVPYVFTIDENNQDGTLTRDQIVQLKALLPDKKIIMNARSWDRNGAHVQSVTDVVDGVCIEYIPSNTPYNIAKHVAPFAEWAYNNNKVLFFLMPPQPDDYMGTRYVDAVKQLARTVYDENTSLPQGWMKSDKFIFIPANYTFGTSLIPYVTEDSTNSILAAAKALLYMRPELDAGLVIPGAEPKANIISPLILLLD